MKWCRSALLRFFLSITSTCLLCIDAVAQEATPCSYIVQGVVRDLQTNEPLMFANVLIADTDTGTTTDEDGFFTIEGICEKEFDLVISYVGYKSIQHHHDYHHSTVEVFLVSEEHTLESVIVEAEHHAGSLVSGVTEKLDLKKLPNKSTESLGDVASSISGVNTLSTGQNIVKPIIHGLHSNRILMINEGLRHEYQNWGRDHAPEIDPSLADRLEVIKGASTVRYGPSALGGVILINAPDLELSSGFGGEVQITGKSNGRSGEATLQMHQGFKWISLMAGGSVLKQGDLHAPDYQLTNTGKDEASLMGGLRLHPLPELDVEVRFSHFKQELGILRGSVNGNLDDLLLALDAEVPNFTEPFSYDINPPKQEVSHTLAKVETSWVGQKQSFSLQYGYQFNTRQEFDVRKGTDTPVPNIDLQLSTSSIEGLWRHPSWYGIQGSVGVQWDYQKNENLEGTNTIPFIPNYKQTRYGVHLIEQLEYRDHVFEMGLRYDHVEADITGRQPNNLIYRNEIQFESFSGTIGYSRKFGDGLNFRSNLGTAWRPPNIAELYRFGRHLSFIEYGLWRYEIDEGSDFVTTRRILTEEDKPLTPEVGYKWISSLTRTTEKIQWELTGYVNFITDYIYARPAGITRTVRGTTPFFIYDQTDALFWGLDLSINLQHTSSLASHLKGSYLWSAQVPDGDKFVGQPPPRVSWQFSYEAQDWAFFSHPVFSMDLAYHFRQTQYPRIIPVDELLNAYQTDLDLFVNDASDFDIIAPPNGYLLTNFSAQTSISDFILSFEVKNLFNVRYRSYTDRLRYFADDLGRNFILSLRYNW